MKKGDKVYVNWPTGKGGPYEVVAINEHGVRIRVYHQDDSYDFVSVNETWCEPDKPRFQEGRLYSATNHRADRKVIGFPFYNDYGSIILGSEYVDTWDISPVNRQWQELTDKQREKFLIECQRVFHRTVPMNRAELIYKIAYILVTDEDHP